MPRILMVESDSAAMRLATLSLMDAGFQVAQHYDADEAVREAGRQMPDASVIDLCLPAGQGHMLCRWLRAESDAPILALTELSLDNDVDDGMEDGANDYLIKPYGGPVLVARLRALLRRSQHRSNTDHLLKVRDLVIDQQRLQAAMAGRQVNLTPTQFRILCCLARNAGRVMTSRELLKEAQGYECDEQEAQEIVKVHINHLRQKIERDSGNPAYIMNVRGFGYMLERRTHPH